MERICRLCCSTEFVNNYIFDDENALYAKMSLYLPVKVLKEDNLPHRVCDRCSCKVNDLYQFCNEVIEAQKKLRAAQPVLYDVKAESIDLTIVKSSESPCPAKPSELCDQGTQTEPLQQPLPVKDIKEEPKVKPEKNGSLSSMGDYPGFGGSDNDDDVTLKDMKQRKKMSQTRAVSNGRSTPKAKRKKRKSLEFTDPDRDLDVVKTEPEVLLEVKSEETEIVTFTCCMCFMQCCSRNDLLHHYRLHESAAEYPPVPTPPPPPATEPIKCMRCQKTLEKSQWEMHWARHWQRDLRPFKCSLCEKTFRNPQQILKHGLNHKPGTLETNIDLDKRFGCDFCPEEFVYMRSLLSHRVTAHPSVSMKPVSLRCVQCGRGFAHLNSLRRHQRAHSGSRDFLCSVCGKALSSQEHLKFHLRIHTGYKPNVCKTCGKGFVKKCNLTLHERVHSGEKPHVCSHCGKAFSQRSTLVIHERYHSGARPYVCGLCGRGFVAKGLLSMHLKTTCI